MKYVLRIGLKLWFLYFSLLWTRGSQIFAILFSLSFDDSIEFRQFRNIKLWVRPETQGGWARGRNTFRRKWKNEKEETEKERKKEKRWKISLKSNFCYQHYMCKGFFFLQRKKNLVLSEINYLGIFISILFVKWKGLYYFFGIFRDLSFSLLLLD